MRVLVIAEHDHQQLKTSTLHTISAGLQLAANVDVMVVGYQCAAIAEQLRQVAGVAKVILADAEVYQHQLPENLTPLVGDLAKNYRYILAPATAFGKNLLPRLSAVLDVAQLSDVTEILADDTFIRPIYAGNAFARVKMTDPIGLLTIRTTAFPAAAKGEAQAELECLDIVIPNKQSRFVDLQQTVSARPDLGDARIVISGGRGLQSAENFNLLNSIADHLGAAIGASRAAVDAGFAPNDYQVGQTGKIVAPLLYIAVGISGAIQHLAGMKDSKIIVAINKDPEAPIFQIADYGLVGDLFEILPELEKGIVAIQQR